MNIQFFGAAQTVTGSRFLVRHGKSTLLVDCGMFQGRKKLRKRNWDPFPIDPKEIDAVLLTHAHIDHTGYLPRIVRQGYDGPVYCTPATADLLEILLRDCAHIQEEEAEYRNRKKHTRHHPALPLFTGEDADNALRLLTQIQFDKPYTINEFTASAHPTAHLIGASSIHISNGSKSIMFSGDLGHQKEAPFDSRHIR